MRRKFLFWNDKKHYEAKTRSIIVESFRPTKYKKKCKMFMISVFDHFMNRYNTTDRLIKALRKGKLKPHAIVRREEHSKMWSNTDEWKKVIRECHSLGITPMFYDFGYFEHYSTYMVDTYDVNGNSSIYSDWPNMSDEIDWDNMPKYVRSYRRRFLEELDVAKNNPPPEGLESGKFVVIWLQGSMKLLRPEFRDGPNIEMQVEDWANRVSKAVMDKGLIPIIKGGPGIDSWTNLKMERVKYSPVYLHWKTQLKNIPEAKFIKDINPILIAHAKYHILSSSSVTNELVMAGVPVVAMGQSWFNGLEIFNEPKSWETLLDNPMEINEKNRNKWVNWWMTKQVPMESIVKKLINTYDQYKIK